MSESKLSCPHCEQHILIDDAWAGQTINCPSCQKPFQVPAAEAPVASEAPPPPVPPPGGLRINRPAAPPPPPPSGARAMPGGRPTYAAAPAVQPRTSGLAIASLILSILGCFGLTAIAAVICGHMARKRISRDPSLKGGGMALAGLIIGYLTLGCCVAGVTFTAVRMRQFGKEFSAEFEREMAKQSQTKPGGDTQDPATGMGSDEAVWNDARTETPTPAVPEGAVSGNIKGDAFTYSKSTLATNMGLFSVSDGEDFLADRQVQIFLFPKAGESFENRTWKITSAGTGSKPHVHLRWQENGAPQSQAMMSGYQLELTTGSISNGVLSGTLNLKITTKVPTELKGKFSAVVE
jgi:hypothetical protein